jgi:hypothetical protein
MATKNGKVLGKFPKNKRKKRKEHLEKTMTIKKGKVPKKFTKDRKVKKREIDKLVNETRSSWTDSMVFISKKAIRTWKAIFIVAFATGIVAAIVTSVYLNIQSQSGADNGASLVLDTDDDAIVTLKDGSNLVNIDVELDSHNNNVVVAKAEINYDPAYFKLESWSTTNSIFATGNSCKYNDKPCEIINTETAGKISITLAKPSPGVASSSGDASGLIAQLQFKALKIVSPSSPNITLSFTPGSYEDSDVISDDGNGTDILSSVTNAQVSVYTAICTDFIYSQWGTCQSNGTQVRTAISGIPEGCGGGTPVFSQACNYDLPCTGFTYNEWSACQPNGTQSRTVATSTPAGCFGGAEPVLTQSCTYVPSCTSFTYDDWGACQSNNTQSRTVATSTPAGCSGGEVPVLTQSCTYVPPIDPSLCTKFEYNDWGACQSNNTQTRTVKTYIPAGCSGGEAPILTQSCTYVPQKSLSCTSFTYNDWGACQSNNTQSRTVATSTPTGCSGGEVPVLTQSCIYTPAQTVNDNDKEEKDKEDPKITDLPMFLKKHRGEKIWWKATDNKGIDYYTYNFDGKKEKTTRKHFFVPVSASKGIHTLRLKAFDEAGNSKSRLVTVLIY